MDDAGYRELSFWHDSHPGSLAPRPALDSERQVDVAIVGAGYTGLWTAYYLKALEPGIRVAIAESEIAGFGASGRNGGWCVGLLAGIESLAADPARREGVIRLQRAVFDAVAEVGRVSDAEGIDCHYARGGSVSFASVAPHLNLLRADLEYWREMGFGDEDVRWLEADESRKRVGARRNLGGLLLEHCAAIHPLRLARGLAEVVERRGVEIYERSPVTQLENGGVRTPGGRLRAETVVRATEGYTGDLPGVRRQLIPLHSMMVATEPLPESVWQELGLSRRETFQDPRRMVVYGQRTADDRLAFGARGQYLYASRVRRRFDSGDPLLGEVQQVLESIFPVLRDYGVSHRWGGALGVPRDWRPSVGIDSKRGFAWAGGYVGDGVAASNLAGRTLADLILRRESERVTLPWVGRPFPNWEPEPLRWLGVSGTRWLGEVLDRAELQERRAPRLADWIFRAFVRK